jgi:hypothetical protein
MNSKRKHALGALLVVLTLSCLVWFNTNDLDRYPNNRLLVSYLTSSTRSAVVSSTCSGYTREDFSANNQTAMSSYVDSLNSSLGVNGYL